jgi:hypothetical protein
MKPTTKELRPFTPSLKCGEAELEDFRKLLKAKGPLSERKDILPFFRTHEHLAALVGSIHIPVNRIDRIGHELDIFSHFRCDLAVGNSAGRAYSLIEFEDASEPSVFRKGPKYNDEWGARLEHGFSQLVDWFWTIDDQRHTDDFRHRFGGSDAEFLGLLVVGRRQFLPPRGADRLRWRSSQVSIRGHKISCITFDDLYEGLKSHLDFLRSIADAGDLK